MKRKICIIGMGLIGGSIALSIKKEHDVHIAGIDIDQNQLRLAQSLKVIDEPVESLAEGVQDADLIVIAVPVTKTEQIIEELETFPLKEGAIVTDVGSTKNKIFHKAKRLFEKGVTFIGGHPMAGSHKSGVQAAKPHLFENAFYVLTPCESTDMNKVIQLQNWLKGTQARFIELTPEQHDHFAGLISHLPHIIAAGLVQQVKRTAKEDNIVARLAAGGFRDITRIASASPVMWRDVLLHNKDIILSLLDDWKEEMKRVEKLLEEEDPLEIQHYFASAKSFRDGLPSREKGALPAFYDLFVDVPDHPGVISDVTGILGKAGISITNIHIIETREDIMGVLQLTFRTEADRENGRRHLEEALYETYIME
ncbi:prephenate dehydrogenase [Alteribacillus persepolensis]|uniref:Prephenate dehydrogenase n=1 Tax=Alteribacillus persepolensis TaxID=568899 RepID=A0A1G7ZFB2_9BACI|nr:prephenate dehydrogenase [Alteribacillus persepolensis]SDH07329.1 prephenate dehydrogenase [Alteribacillus persepolensis]